MLGYFFFSFWNSGEEKKTLFKMLRSGYIAQFSPLDLYVLRNNFKIKFFLASIESRIDRWKILLAKSL